MVKAARIAANEDARPLRRRGPDSDGTSGEPTTDTLAILQVVHDFAAWKRITHAAALRRLAPHVSGARPAKKRRHAVYATLPAMSMAAPALWQDAIDGDWRVHGPLWARFRDAVRRLVREGFTAPFPYHQLVAWGCDDAPECDDTPIARRRGLVRADDHGITGIYQNSFWALRPRVLDASEARGGR